MKNIDIGGQKRPIRYNHNALEEFEELTGLSMMEESTIEQLRKAKNQKALAFVGLKHGFLESVDYNPDKEVPFTLQQVGRWLDTSNTETIFKNYRNDTESDGGSSGEGGESKKSVGETSAV